MILLISLFSKNDDEGGGGQKSQKIDDVFYEWPLVPKFEKKTCVTIFH